MLAHRGARMQEGHGLDHENVDALVGQRCDAGRHSIVTRVAFAGVRYLFLLWPHGVLGMVRTSPPRCPLSEPLEKII